MSKDTRKVHFSPASHYGVTGMETSCGKLIRTHKFVVVRSQRITCKNCIKLEGI
jgi:hypothetical protein